MIASDSIRAFVTAEIKDTTIPSAVFPVSKPYRLMFHPKNKLMVRPALVHSNARKSDRHSFASRRLESAAIKAASLDDAGDRNRLGAVETAHSKLSGPESSLSALHACALFVLSSMPTMIRTHKPSGHHWTCASHFQQSKQYRNLDAQDWDPPCAKALVTDPDDKLPASQHVAKRRRVEALANDFLEGKPLFISSACANGPDLSATVDKVLFDRRLDWDHLDDYDENMWADGEDGWAALEKRNKARAAYKSSTRITKVSRRISRARTSHAPKAVEKPQPPLRSSSTVLRPEISTAPSEEALNRAAELRTRRASLMAKTAPRPEDLLPATRQISHSAPPTARDPSSFSYCVSSRPFDPNTPADTTMADELRLSRTDSPSHRPRSLTMPLKSFSSGTTVEDGLEQFLYVEPTAAGSAAMELCTAVQNISRSRNSISSDKNAEVPHSRPTTTSAKPNPIWTPINDMNAQHAESGNARYTHHRHPLGTDPSASRSTAGNSESKAAGVTPMPTAKSTSPRATRSTRKSIASTAGDTHQSSQRSSQSRLTNSFKASKSEYVTEEKSQNGLTPFMYRKKTRSSKEGTTKFPDEESLKKDEQSEKAPWGAKTPNPTHSTAFPSVSAAPPTLEMSFENSSIAPALNLALVDQHVNQKLPNSPGSTHRSLSVKKALRNEMRFSGADISRAPGEPSSSQPMEHDDQSPTSAGVEREDVANTRHASKRRSTGQWPGTQVLLSKAQHDLFMSPDKVAIAAANSPAEPHDNHYELSEVHSAARQPMRQLSQERLPGTQALMDDWSPWSTVKKSKPGKRASFAPSPLMSKDKASPTELSTRSLRSGDKLSLPSERLQETKQRRSSLRFSTSTSETPISLRQKSSELTADVSHGGTNPGVTASHSTDQSAYRSGRTGDKSQTVYGATAGGATSHINLDFSTLSFATTAAKDTSNVDDSMADWSAHDRDSKSQNAQKASTGPSPEEVLNELATEFLSTADIEGVLGRV